MELSGKSFAVIGGAGFIGSHVSDQLLGADAGEIVVFDDLRRGRLANLADASRDKRVRFVQGSTTDRDQVASVIAGSDGVFLLAALWLDECARDPRAAWDVNVLGTWNVVEACREAGLPRIVFSSSASVYGDALTVPIAEDHPLANKTVYGATKIACEQMLRAAAGWGQAYVGLRYMNVYGPRMDRLGAYVSVIVRTLEEISAGRPPIIHGDGTQTFDFVHVDDVARANLLAMEAGCSDDLINIGSGHGTTILDLSRQLCELMGVPFDPRYESAPRPSITRRVGSTDRARSLLRFEAKVSLATGLRSVIDWWQREKAPAAMTR